MKSCEITVTKQKDGLFRASLSEAQKLREGLAGFLMHRIDSRFESANDAVDAARKEAANRGLTVSGEPDFDEDH